MIRWLVDADTTIGKDLRLQIAERLREQKVDFEIEAVVDIAINLAAGDKALIVQQRR